MYTGDYTFTLPKDLQFSINGVNYNVDSDGKCIVRLNGVSSGSPHQIVITNNTNQKVISTLNCKLNDLGESVNVGANNQCLVGYNSSGGLKQVKVDNNCTIDILSIGSDGELVKLKGLTQNDCYFNFIQEKKYYFLVKNSGETAVNATVTIEDPAFYDVSKEYTVAVSGELYVSYNLQPGIYGFEYSTTANFFGTLQTGIYVSEDHYVETEKSCRVIYLSQPQCVNFKFTSTGTGTDTANFTLYSSTIDYEWEVSSQSQIRLEGNNLYIMRGAEAEVKFKVGTTYYNSVQKIGDYTGWSYNPETNKLAIDSSCALTSSVVGNTQHLAAIYGEDNTIQTLNIHVISDIRSVNFQTFSNDSGYGIEYDKISNNPDDRILIELDIPDVIDPLDEFVVAIGNKWGSIYLNEVDRQPNAPKHYTATIREITIGGAIVFSIQDPDNVDYIQINNVFYISTLFAEGDGSEDHPFIIESYKQFKNLSAYSTTYSYFEVAQNIYASGYWTPIPMFNGRMNGNNHRIYDLSINITDTSSTYYGLFRQLKGTVANLIFDSAIIRTTLTYSADRIYVGVIAGYAQIEGISGCTVTASEIDIKIYNSSVGGIAGYNTTSLVNNIVSYTSFYVSGEVGGCVGRNNGFVSHCASYLIGMSYHWDTDNGKIGGIVGYNQSGASVIQCESSGSINWTSPRKGAEIYPAMGYIIGYNAKDSLYGGCSSTMQNNITYYTRKIFGPYDQSGWCFKFDDGKIGWQES